MAAKRQHSARRGLDELRREVLDGGEVKPVLVLVGEDQLRIEAAVQKIRRLVLDPASAGFNEQILYGDQVGWAEVLQAARCLSMFGGRRLVWLRKVEALDTRKDDPGLAALEELMAAPPGDSVLLITGEKVDGRRSWVGKARKLGFLYQFDAPVGAELMAWLARAAAREGLTLDQAGREVLVALVGSDLRALQEDLARLALIEEQRGQPLRAEELPELVMDQGDLEVFAMTDALGSSDAAEALRTWWRLKTWGSDPYQLSPIVASFLRRMALTASGDHEGLNPEQIASASTINGWMIKKRLLPYSRKLGDDAANAALSTSLTCERALKSRPIPPATAFERLLIALAAQHQAP